MRVGWDGVESDGQSEDKTLAAFFLSAHRTAAGPKHRLIDLKLS